MEKAELRKLIDTGLLQGTPDLQLWEQELQELVEKGFLQHLSQQELYAFTNNLSWEVVYETLLFAERRRLHNLVAIHIEKQNKDKLDSVASILLHHYDKADNKEKTIIFGARAGDKAGSLFANNDAISFYQTAIDALSELGHKSALDVVLLLERTGDVYDLAGEYNKADLAYQEALQIWLNREGSNRILFVPWKLKVSTYESALCRKLAVVNERSSEYDKAIMWLNSAEQSLPERPGKVRAQILSTRSGILYRQGEYDESIKISKTAIKIAKKLKAHKELAYANNVLTNALQKTGSSIQAIEVMNAAIEIYKEQEDISGLAISYYNLGTCYTNVGDLKSAEEYFRKALDIDTKMQNQNAIAMDISEIAEVLARKGELEQAIEHFNNVVALFKQGKCVPDLAGIVLYKLCQLYIATNELDKAKEAITYGLELLRKVGIKIQIYSGELQLADLKCQLKEYDEAEQICNEILAEISNDNNLFEIHMQVTFLLGDIFFGAGKFEESVRNYDKCAEVAANTNSEFYFAQAVLARSRVLFEMDNIDSNTLNTLESVIAIFARIDAASFKTEAEELYRKIEQKL